MKKMIITYSYFLAVVTLLVIFSTSSSLADSVECLSESDCAIVCEQFEQQLNDDDNIPDVYDCSIVSSVAVEYETGGETEVETSFNCLCTSTGSKGDDGDAVDDPGKTRPEPPVIIDPIEPNLPPVKVPPDNPLSKCLADATRVYVAEVKACASKIIGINEADADEIVKTSKFDILTTAEEFANCKDEATNKYEKAKARCNKNHSLKLIKTMDKLPGYEDQ